LGIPPVLADRTGRRGRGRRCPAPGNARDHRPAWPDPQAQSYSRGLQV